MNHKHTGTFIHLYIQELIRCPFQEIHSQAPQPNHGDTYQS